MVLLDDVGIEGYFDDYVDVIYTVLFVAVAAARLGFII